jgi:hypothetical protein
MDAPEGALTGTSNRRVAVDGTIYNCDGVPNHWSDDRLIAWLASTGRLRRSDGGNSGGAPAAQESPIRASMQRMQARTPEDYRRAAQAQRADASGTLPGADDAGGIGAARARMNARNASPEAYRNSLRGAR